MKFQIITDTCCDFPVEMYQQLELVAVPMAVRFRGEEVARLDDAWIKEIYDGLRKGESATTAAVNPQTWQEIMEESLKVGKDVLVLPLSSGLSTTYQSAMIAKSELEGKYPERTIRVVDTLAASMGQGLFVWYACKLRDEGKSANEVADWCEDNKQNLCHWFTVDDLMYLKRGGRVSAATALMGTMLQIKPILHCNEEGKLVSVGKVRGRKAAIQGLAKKLEELGLPGENETCFISHGDCPEDAETLATIIREKYGVRTVITSYIGAVIGSHSGPGTLALFFLGAHR